MESSLHRSLKERYADPAAGGCEVAVDGFRIDAVDAEGRLVEVQSAPLSALRGKLRRLLETRRVRVVKPVTLARRIVRRERLDGPDLSARWSPYRGELSDVFDDLVGLARIFPHPNLVVEVVGVEVAEIRTPPSRRRRLERTLDRELIETGESTTLAVAEDLWRLIPRAPEPGVAFTTLDLAERTGRSVASARRAAYCLRLAGAVDDLGRTSRFRLYARKTSEPRTLNGDPTYERAGEVPARR